MPSPARYKGTHTNVNFTIVSADPCEGKYCGQGRECQASEDGRVGVCVCLRRCISRHPGRHRPLCGSDGNFYANYCELHRAACNLGTHLTVSRIMRCLHRGKLLEYFKIISWRISNFVPNENSTSRWKFYII